MADKPKVKPSSAGIWIGLLLLLVGLGGCIGGVGYTAFTVADKVTGVPDSAKVDVPGEQSYEFKGTSSGLVVAYGPTASDLDSIQVTLTGPNGRVNVEDTELTASTSTTDTGAFRIIGAFSDQPSGKYTLASTGPEGGSVALVSADLGSLLAMAGGGLLGGSLLALIGFLLLVITAVRRSKAKKKFQNSVPTPGLGAPVGAYTPHGAGPGAMPPPAPGMAPPPAGPAGMPPFNPAPPPNYPPAPQGYPAAPPAAPTYEQPTYEQPTYQQPAYQPPPEQYQPPAPTYEQPAPPPPTYEQSAPAYSPPPAYDAPPADEAPAPSYESPAAAPPPAPTYDAPPPPAEAPVYDTPTAPDSTDYPPPPPPPGGSST